MNSWNKMWHFNFPRILSFQITKVDFILTIAAANEYNDVPGLRVPRAQKLNLLSFPSLVQFPCIPAFIKNLIEVCHDDDSPFFPPQYPLTFWHTPLLFDFREINISDWKVHLITCMAGLGWYLNCLMILVHKMDSYIDLVDVWTK